SDSETLDGSGKASFTTTGLDTNYHTLVVNYLGDNTFAAGSNARFGTAANGIQVVADTSTTLTSTALNAVAGQPVTFTAVVHPAGTVPPNGFVNFILYYVPVGSNTLNAAGLGRVPVDAGGVATFTAASLPVSTVAVTAYYTGAAVFNGSAATL